MIKIFLDTETTGLDVKTCSIYQLAGVVVKDGIIKEYFDYSINPLDAEEEEEAVTLREGFDFMEVYNYPDPKVVFTEFVTMLNKYIDPIDIKDKAYLCAYNAHFDAKFIRKFFNDNYSNFYGSYFWSNYIDVMHEATLVFQNYRHNIGSFSLANICKLFDIPIEAHNAYSDAVACMHLHDSLAEYIHIKPL